MTRRDRGRVALPWGLGALLLAAVLVVGAGLGWTSGRLNAVVCGGPCGPEAVAPPEGLALAASPGRPTPDPVSPGLLDAAAVRDALEPLLDDDALGDRVGVSVLALDGTQAFERDATETFVPASTTKLLTAFATLSQLDPGARFSTSTVLDGNRVVLVGGGDPYLASSSPKEPTRVDRADLRTLATRTAAALDDAGVASVSLGYDAGLFTGPSASPEWEDTYVSGQVVTPISALWADRGITDGVRAANPAGAAAERFAGYLADAGIDVEGDPEQVQETSAGEGRLAAVQSATVSQIVDAMLVRSDNEAAEVLLRQVGLASGGAGSFADGADAVTAALTEADVPVQGLRLNDGSGLSRANRVAPATLAGVLQTSASRASTAELLADLPVGGLSGTLADRFDVDSAGRGLVRAKTGTLTGVHSLSGYTTDAGGVPVVFAVMTDDTEAVDPFVTQAAIDDVAAALAACRCGS